MVELDDNLLKKISTFTFLIGLILLTFLLYTTPYKKFTSLSQTKDTDSDYKLVGTIINFKQTQSKNYKVLLKTNCSETIFVGKDDFYGKINDIVEVKGKFFGTGNIKQLQSTYYRVKQFN